MVWIREVRWLEQSSESALSLVVVTPHLIQGASTECSVSEASGGAGAIFETIPSGVPSVAVCVR